MSASHGVDLAATRPAGMAARATALIIDLILTFFILGWIVARLAGQTQHGNGSFGFRLHGSPAFAWIVVALGYFIVCEHIWGATIGERIFSIRVQAAEGGTPTWGQSISRNL